MRQAFADRARRVVPKLSDNPRIQNTFRSSVPTQLKGENIRAGVALPLHLPVRGSLSGEDKSMSARLGLIRMALAGMLAVGCTAVLPLKTLGQDSAGEAAKRKIKTKVVPDYPAVARQLNLQGKVKIETTISAEGRVTNTKVVGGNPVLAYAAQDAVKKWRFEPAPKDTTEIIEIDFTGAGRE